MNAPTEPGYYWAKLRTPSGGNFYCAGLPKEMWVSKQALLTESEAAEALRLCPRTLRKARQDGALRFVKFGRTIRYTPDDLDQFIERSRECLSTVEKAPRSGNTRSPSTVFDFEEALAARESARRK